MISKKLLKVSTQNKDNKYLKYVLIFCLALMMDTKSVLLLYVLHIKTVSKYYGSCKVKIQKLEKAMLRLPCQAHSGSSVHMYHDIVFNYIIQ